MDSLFTVEVFGAALVVCKSSSLPVLGSVGYMNISKIGQAGRRALLDIYDS